MAINLYGNVSGTYQKPNIDLFEMARKQNNQPVKFCDTEAGKNLPAIKVNISEEGLRALHGSKMKGSVDIQKQMEEMQKEVEAAEFEASVGGGAISVRVNGKKEVLGINIKPEVVDPDDVEMLEDLVLSAVNEALRKADEETANKMGKLTGGLKMPGLF